jgi:hypothetical protein
MKGWGNKLKLLSRDYDYCFEEYENVSLVGVPKW